MTTQEKLLTGSVLNYMKASKANNAIMINGEWGTGKTFFVKKKLIPQLHEAYPKGNIVYISLNGISSENALQKRLFTSMIQAQNKVTYDKSLVKKENSIKASFLKKISRKTVNSSFEVGIKSLFDYLGEDSQIASSLVNVLDFMKLDNSILIFDDLERVNVEKYPFDDLFGFINNQFIEHDGHKTIFIGHEKREGLFKETNYTSIKEKLIGWTIEYKPTLKEVIPELISIHNKHHEPEYIDFLKKHQDFIIKCFEEIDYHNLRTILFFLDCLEIIFATIKFDYENVELDLIYFSIIASVEYKSGGFCVPSEDLPIDIQQKPFLDVMEPFMGDDQLVLTMFGEKEEATVVTKTEEERIKEEWEVSFNKKYMTPSFYKGVNYIFIRSVYNLVQTGSLEIENLKTQLDKLKLERSPNEFNLIHRLKNFRIQTNEQFEADLKETMDVLEKAEVSLYYYMNCGSVLLYVHSTGILNSKFTHSELELLLLSNIDKTIPHTKSVWDGIMEYQAQSLIDSIKGHSIAFAEAIAKEHYSLLNEKKKDDIEGKFDDWGTEGNIDFVDVLVSINEVGIAKKLEDSLVNKEVLERIEFSIEKTIENKEIKYRYGGFPNKISQLSTKLKTLAQLLRGIITTKELKLIDKYWLELFEKHFDSYGDTLILGLDQDQISDL